jgi:SPP1 family predicted phage head-tail adaptor
MITTSIRAGDLRDVIVIQALPTAIARNPDGSEKRTTDQWATFATARAKIDSQGGKEFYAAKTVNAALTHEITVRWQQGITTGMRAQFIDPVEGTTRYFDIQSIVNPNSQERWILLLHCRELIGREVQS